MDEITRKKMKIEEALEKEITRGNCSTCPKRYQDQGADFCAVTEEAIGSGEEYCELKPIEPKIYGQRNAKKN